MESNVFELFSQQEDVLNCDARFIAATAGIQGGKTTTGALKFLQYITRFPQEDFLLAAPTYKILEQSTLPKFFSIIPSYVGKYYKQDSVFKLHGGGNIYIRSTEIPQNIEGMTVKAAWLDEGGMMKSQVWTFVQGRVAIKRGFVIITTTPYNLGWVYKDVVLKARQGYKDFANFTWRSIDNPYFPKAEYFRAKEHMHPADFDRRYNGAFRKLEGLIYSEFDPSTMVYEDKPDLDFFTERIAGIDYGYTNPFAMEVLGIGKDNNLHVIDELYQSKLQINDQVAKAMEMKETYDISAFYVDPSAPALIDALNNVKLNAYPANNDVNFGIVRVRQLIASKRFRVWKQCYNLIDEIDMYHYNPKLVTESSLEYKEQPIKEFDHAVDALRYPVATFPMEIFDTIIPLAESRKSEFWQRVANRMKKRTIKKERFGDPNMDDEEFDLYDSIGL